MKFSASARQALLAMMAGPCLLAAHAQERPAQPVPPQLPGQPAAAPQTAVPASIAAAVSPGAALHGTLTLDPKLLVQMLVARSADIAYSRLQVEVTGQLRDAEAALYETVLYSTVKREARFKQRSVEDRIQSLATSQIDVLDEDINSDEIGVRNRLPTGGDLSVGYRTSKQRNNIIAQTGTYDTEYNAALTLTLRQPLMRGRGRGVTETDKKVAELDAKITLLQYRQQFLKTCNDALTSYWQLYRALEAMQLREQAMENGRKLLDDTQARIRAGKAPASNLIEVKATVALREVELLRSQQAVTEAQAHLLSLLNISGLTAPGLTLLAKEDQQAMRMADKPVEDRFQQALALWPPVEIAKLHQEQADARLQFADNQRLPTMDLIMSKSRTGLSNEASTARSLARQNQYPDWYVGLNIEVPLEGNRKAQSQYHAQQARVRQAQLEGESVVTTLANDIRMRAEQAVAARREVTQMQRDVELRTQLTDIERVRYESGMGLIGQLLQREAELFESRQRLVDSVARLGQANIALMYADGSLLQQYGITLKE